MADGSPPVAASTDNPVEKEALQRLADARKEKSTIENDLQNCYFYAAPRRVRRQGSQAQSDPQRSGDDRQLQTSFGFEVADDFASMLIETFMPREGPWAERSLPPNPDEDGNEDDETKQLNDLIAGEDQRIFGLVRASNFYAEVAKGAAPDAAIGLCAMLITDPGAGRPVQCLAVPIREVDMDHGPDGRPDFRSITRKTKNMHVAAHLGKTLWERVPNERRKDAKEKPNQPAEIVWAWWRNWEAFGSVEWKHVVMLDGKLIHETSLTGEGSVAFVLGRFGATPDFAWPDGPLVKSLADLVQLDELRGALIENIDFTLRPPLAYDDDGTINLPVDGLKPGDAVPKRPAGGNHRSFEKIYEPNSIDAGLFELDHLISRIRRLHYVDFPEQRGKTPPTATQWIDELVIRQRRIGTPGFAFWHEFPYEVFQRFRFLGERRGDVRKLESLPDFPKNVTLQPYNPAERAQDSQDVATAVKFAQIGQMIAPTMWQVRVDEGKSLDNLRRKMRDKVIVLRTEEEAEERIQMLTQLGERVLSSGVEQQRRGGTEQ